MILHRNHRRLILLFGLYCCAVVGPLTTVSYADEGDPKTSKKFSLPFFDGIKLQTTNCNPKLTNANHLVDAVNKVTGADLDNWDTLLIQSADVVLWKDLSRYFKTDVCVAGSTGSLVSSGTAFKKTPLDFKLRMRQRYSAVELWSNLYFYPFTTDYKDQYKSGHIIEPFIAAGIGYTFFRSESVFKLRKGDYFYNRLRTNWNGDDWAFKMMTGFNVNLGNVTPRFNRWIITIAAFQIWNRMQGHSNMYVTEGLKLGGHSVPLNLHGNQKMDIDLTGPYFSLAIGRYF